MSLRVKIGYVGGYGWQSHRVVWVCEFWAFIAKERKRMDNIRETRGAVKHDSDETHINTRDSPMKRLENTRLMRDSHETAVQPAGETIQHEYDVTNTYETRSLSRRDCIERV